MICYKDMKFCPFYQTCKQGRKCYRALTEIVQKLAQDSKLPICTYTEKPGCYKAKK